MCTGTWHTAYDCPEFADGTHHCVEGLGTEHDDHVCPCGAMTLSVAAARRLIREP